MSDQFEIQRPFLRGLAYRLLGCVSDTDDVLQDAWIRWRDVAENSIDNPRAYLARIVTNLSLDRLTSAHARRAQYVGQWLPEPLLTEPSDDALDPATRLSVAEDLSMALLCVLERLSPLERAAWVLHEVFDFSFAEIGAMLQREAAACRQLATRARAHLQTSRPRYRVGQAIAHRLQQSFISAVSSGDLSALTQLLAEDAGFFSDGGGKVAAVPKPLFGAARIAQVILGFASLYAPGSVMAEPAYLNGEPGFILRGADGEFLQTITFSCTQDNRIADIYVQRNPDKLAHLVG